MADKRHRASLTTSSLISLQEKWPKDVIALGDVVGGLSSEAAAHLGLREGLPVAQGGADAFVGMGERPKRFCAPPSPSPSYLSIRTAGARYRKREDGIVCQNRAAAVARGGVLLVLPSV